MRIYYIFIVLLVLIAALGSHAQQQTSKTSLLIASCTAKTKECEPQTIKRLNFEHGKLVSSEDLLTFDANTTRGGRVTYRLIQNRYVVSSLGDVLDTQTKEMFDQERGDYFGAENNRIFIFQKKSETNVRLISFDLTTKKYKREEPASVFFVLGMHSPSMLRSVQYNSTAHTLEIHHRFKNRIGEIDTFIDGRFKATCGKTCKDEAKRLPKIWLDDDRLLTQKQNGELVVIDLKKERTFSIVKIPVKKELESVPVLYKDFAGNIHYLADKDYLIDIDNRNYKETSVSHIGNGFQISVEPGEKIFTFNGKEIGKFKTAYYRTARNYLAVEFNDQGESYYFPEGVRIWSAETAQWTNLDVNYFSKIIGWLEN